MASGDATPIGSLSKSDDAIEGHFPTMTDHLVTSHRGNVIILKVVIEWRIVPQVVHQ
jgi:hypothetical protein